MKKRKFFALGLSFLLVAALVLTGCPAEEVVEEPVVEEPVVEEPVIFKGFPRSETLFVQWAHGRAGAPDNFNEWVGWKNRDRGMAQLMNEPLWTTDFAHGVYINSLAAALPEYNEDLTQMTIRLREGVYWSDGVEFTADDVVFTILFNRDNVGLNWTEQMQEVESVSAPDKYTVVIELTGPNSRFHVHLVDRWGCLWMMPKHVWENVVDPIPFEYNPPLSLGPYVLHSYDPAGFWTAWERREDWERTPTGMLYGKPKPEYVMFTVYEEPAEVIDLVRNEIDVTYLTMEGIKAALDANPNLRTYRAGVPWVNTDDPWGPGIGFNTDLPPYDIKDVRWALALAIDIVSCSLTAFDGGMKALALAVPDSTYYGPILVDPLLPWLDDFTIEIEPGVYFAPWDPDAPYRIAEAARDGGYVVPTDLEEIKEAFGVGWWKYAPDVAARLLEKHGFTRDKDEMWLLPDGTPWKMTIISRPTAGDVRYQMAWACAHEWRKFGIDTTVKLTEMYSPICSTGEFEVSTEVVVQGPFGAYPDLYKSFDDFNSKYWKPLGEYTWGNLSRWTDPRMDQIISDLAATAWGEDERLAELSIEGIKLVAEEMAVIPLMVGAVAEIYNTYYWTGWPSAENPYMPGLHCWPHLKYWLPFLEPTGR